MKINTHLTEDAQGNPLYLSNDDGEQIYTFPSPDHIVLRPGSYEVPEIYHFTQEEEDELFDKETASCWEMLAVRWEILAVRSHYEFMTDEQKAKIRPHTFFLLPGELRNRIYNYLFIIPAPDPEVHPSLEHIITLFGPGRVNFSTPSYGDTAPLDDRMGKPSLALSQTCKTIHRESQSFFHEKNFFELTVEVMSLTNPRTSISGYANCHLIRHFRLTVEQCPFGPSEYVDWDCIFHGLSGLSTVQIAVMISGSKNIIDEYIDGGLLWKLDSLKHLRDDSEQPLSHLSLTCPAPSLRAKTTAIASDGIYKQYLEALMAHQRAQERYAAIKEEIHELNDDHERNRVEGRSGAQQSESVREYIQLLRQSRQHRKLEIIQDAVARLVDSESNPVHVDLKASIKEKLGEPPQPPMASLDQSDADSKVEELTFRLKKELLIARSRLEDAKTAKSTAEAERSMEPPTMLEKVETLRKARDELIAWVEGELAKIPEVDPDQSQIDMSFMEDEAQPSAEEISDQDLASRVDELYHRYTTAREKIIANVDATIAANTASSSTTTTISPEANRPSLAHQRTRTDDGLSRNTNPDLDRLATKLLPYLPVLSSTQTSSTSLQAQTSHLRRQLSTSSSETTKTLQRLAGESYLVPQDATSMIAWAKAAEETGGQTNQFVREQVEAGEASISRAKTILEVLKSRKDALGSMRGDL
ncbi:hypothetical protein BLS_002629 [Venturia inaequalis]|uniref:Uncharacterized protein n=1 Tax=Venturia inaequalis TaxID=5025 RepID=A0A8H3VAG1_VENIN|nr:hypothetical protein BLS_002629 [Venturia inaequalis]